MKATVPRRSVTRGMQALLKSKQACSYLSPRRRPRSLLHEQQLAVAVPDVPLTQSNEVCSLLVHLQLSWVSPALQHINLVASRGEVHCSSGTCTHTTRSLDMEVASRVTLGAGQFICSSSVDRGEACRTLEGHMLSSGCSRIEPGMHKQLHA